MLFRDRIENSVNPEPDVHLPAVSLSEVAEFIRRSLPKIIATCLITLGVAVVYHIVVVPRYNAEAQLAIESKGALGDSASVSTIVDSQIGIMKSDSVARAVIRKLDLVKTLEFIGQTGGVRSTIYSILRSIRLMKPETEETAMRLALETFQRNFTVKRVGLTYLVGMSFESTDPQRAALILNTIAKTYISQQLDAKYKYALRDETWIKEQLNELSNQASVDQTALAEFKNRKDLAASADSAAGGTGSQLTAEMQEELRDLTAAADASASALDNFRHMARLTEATRQQYLPVFDARLVSEALPPLRPSSPKVGLILGIATVLGLLFGAAIAVMRELSYRGVRSSEHLWSKFQISCIAVIPMVEPGGVWGKLTTVFSVFVEKLPRKVASLGSHVVSLPKGPVSIASLEESKRGLSKESPSWAIIASSQPSFAESILKIKLAIDLMNLSGKGNQVIGVTSTQTNEGKSTVAAALALRMAHAGARVILVDCNLQNRSLSAALAPGASSGLLEVMTGTVPLSQATWTDAASQLVFLPVGEKSRPISVSGGLASERLDSIIRTMRTSYEYVIVDLPAVASLMDVGSVAKLLDSFIFVVECWHTNIDVAERAIEVWNNTDAIMLGAVLNKA
jgi:capsular exopolysaccharide synthesis family protein